MTTHKHEHFKILKHSKHYNKKTQTFTINISYQTTTKQTPRTTAIAEAFGLGTDQQQKFTLYNNIQLKITPTDIVYITGDSGSGKTTLLKTLQKDIQTTMHQTTTDTTQIQPQPNTPIIETTGKTLTQALELLSKVGLNDAFLFLRTYEQLSDGQKYRYKIAKMIETQTQFWTLDEFAATLDRDTAKIVAYNLQKQARQHKKAVLAATTHTDLLEDLNPSVHIHKRYGQEITVNYNPNTPTKQCSLTKEMQIHEGTHEDWKNLAEFHYRSHRTAATRKIFTLNRNDELCGVIIYAYPPPSCFGRKQVLPKMHMQQLNQELSTINRVVIHPKYRTIGLGAELVKETLPLAGTPFVEMVAVMAKYNPFAEKAGMQKITDQTPPNEASQITELLQKYSLNTSLLGSEKYVLDKFEKLSENKIDKIKEVFIKNPHVRFVKGFCPDKPFGDKQVYVEKLRQASLKQLAGLTRICGMLMQTKVYLFWHNPTMTERE